MGFFINVPLTTSDYFTTVRLATGGLCAQAGIDMDGAEDFKVCVTESLLILKRNGYKEAVLSFEFDGGIKAFIKGNVLGEREKDSVEDDISFALLSALIDNAEFKKDSDGINEIILNKSL